MSSKRSRTLMLASVFALGTAGFAGAQPAPGPASTALLQNHHPKHVILGSGLPRRCGAGWRRPAGPEQPGVEQQRRLLPAQPAAG